MRVELSQGVSPESDLRALSQGTPWLGPLLDAIAGLPVEAWLAAGTVRGMVWDHLHGRMPSVPDGDVDVIWFDPEEKYSEVEIGRLLTMACPGVPWDAVNQATVHRWYGGNSGYRHLPFADLSAAMMSWPETATAIAIRRGGVGQVEVLAPFGLDDLVQMKWRHNPARASWEVCLQRYEDKCIARRWPAVTLCRADGVSQ